MVNTIERTIHLFSLVFFIIGSGILRHPFDRPRLCLSIFYILTVWCVYAWVLYYMTITFPRMVYNFLQLFLLFVNLLVTMIAIITTICKHKKFHTCIRKLGFVDNTLKELEISKKYRTCVDITNDTRATILPIALGYPIYINTYMDIMFVFILRYIGTKLDEINEHIERISKIEKYGLRCTWTEALIVTPYVRSTEEHVLWTAIHLHFELCRIAQDINSLFGIQMTLQMASYFVLCIVLSYIQYNAIRQLYRTNATILKTMLSGGMWFIILLTKLISLNHICESVSTKAQKTKSLIHKLTNIICFAETRKEICQFVLHISLRPLKFNGMGLFYFGYNFIYKFFAWAVTVIIFIVQMDSFPTFRTILSERYNNVTRYN
ncbi:putative gustatory receptor 28a [Linepithema humile]|uniref:putative gustatory receptor 28a n=1 Tax=Linepithema humile TaxID=83485 RepID=UPI00351E71D7